LKCPWFNEIAYYHNNKVISEKNIFIYIMNQVLNQLQLLLSLQCKNDLYFTDGLFPAQRNWAKGFYHRKDNTGFFTACIGFTLMRYQKLFKDEELDLANTILANMRPAFDGFRNKDGQASYNFWQTKPSKHFPGGNFARHFKFFMIPDDIDDSAMVHLVKKHTIEEQLALKDKMGRFALGNLKWPDKPVNGYEEFKSYNTFFVKNMPAAFDVCALCNALYFVYHYKLPLNEQDAHSLKVIVKCIAQDDHLNRPYEMSPYYPNSVLIIYHIVRLMADLDLKELMPFWEKLLTQVNQLLSTSRQSKTEQLILTICLQKLGQKEIIFEALESKEKTHFPFFVAGILGEVSPKWLRSMAFSDKTHIKYQSLAYAETLWLEHLLLNRAASQTILSN
jgi:hypothetical protein